MTDPITSPANPRIKDLVRLRDRRHRDRTGSFLIEGYREISRALDGGVSPTTLFTCAELFLGGNEGALIERAASSGSEIFEVAVLPFRKVSYRDRPDGLIAVAPRFAVGLDALDVGENPLILVAESIEKPGNLGTMLRTADGAGVDAVIAADPTTDPFNPNVVRASVGALFAVPLAVAGTSSAIEYLREQGVRIVATTPAGEVPHFGADLTGGVAVVVGSEQYGLSEAWLEGADLRVAIPMRGEMDSLNAAMAAGVVVFEALRQRHPAAGG